MADSIKWTGGILMPTVADTLWMIVKYSDIPNIPVWRGFHEQITKYRSAEIMKVIFLPFVNASPSDYNTICTSLQMAVEKAKEVQLKTIFVTFDQPLCMKARDIIAFSGKNSILGNIIIRLGGFHTLLSFLGCIGYIMASSGLRQLLSLIYAPNSADMLLAGHAYARAIRGHLLVQLALSNIILEKLPMTYQKRETVFSLLQHFQSPPMMNKINENSVLKVLSVKLESELLKLESNGPTAQLWVQYFHMVTIVKLFIESEREGN